MPKPCTCAEPMPVAPNPPHIHCLRCGGTVAMNHETALQKAMDRITQTQSASLRAAGYAFFLEDLGFDFQEISEYLDKQDALSQRSH